MGILILLQVYKATKKLQWDGRGKSTQTRVSRDIYEIVQCYIPPTSFTEYFVRIVMHKTLAIYPYEMLSVENSSSRLRSCDPVSSSPSSTLSDAHDTVLMGGCGFVGVSGVRMADLLGELVSSFFDFPKKKSITS